MSDEAPSAAAAAPGVPAADETQASEEFLHSLVDAMRGVAEESRDANLAELRRSVDERIAQLSAAAAERADELRRSSDVEVSATADWERAEMDRVKAEAERRVAAQQAELERQLAEHRATSDREIEEARRRLADYERDLTAFFSQLAEIRDPAAFVAAAKRMPRAPELTATPSAASAPATSTAPTAAEPASPAPVPPAEPQAAMAGEEPGSVAPVSEPQASVPAGDQGPEAPLASVALETVPAPAEAPVDSMGERLGELQQPYPDAGSNGHPADASTEAVSDVMPTEAPAPAPAAQQDEAPEPAAAAGDEDGEVSTPIMVKGLGSFGAITSFKQALERADGIHGVTLSLGPGGEFVYRASHASGFDLISAIRAIEGQGASIDESEGSLLVTINRGR